MAFLALLKALPWRWIGGALLLLAAVFFVKNRIDAHDRAVFAAGHTAGANEIRQLWDADKRVWDAERLARAQADIETQRLASMDRAARQEKADAIGLAAQKRLAAAEDRHVRDVRDGDELRSSIDRLVQRPEPAASSGQAASQPDGRVATLGSLLESCDRLASGLAEDAERMRDQADGLREYAITVSSPPTPPPHTEGSTQ